MHWKDGKRPEKTPLFSGVVSYGNLVFISGIGAHFEGDIKAHTKHVLDEMQKKLEGVGSSMEKVLKVNVYLNDLKDYAGMNEVFLGRFGPEPAVRTTIAAAGGIPGNSLVEIDCIADAVGPPIPGPALAHLDLPAVVRELHLVHELVDEVDPAPAVAQQVGALPRVGDMGRVEASAGVADDDHDLARLVAGHAALDALPGVALAAVLDGVGQGLPQRDLDLELLPRRELHPAHHLHDPVAEGRGGRGVRGDHHVELAGRAQGDEAAQLLDVVEGLPQLADQSLLPLLGQVPRLEGPPQLQQVPPQLQLRLGLPLQGLQGRLLVRVQLPWHPVDHAQRAEGVPVGRDEGRARVEPDVRRGTTSGLSRKRASTEASGTTKRSRCLMAWVQKAMLREVSRTETPTRALNHCRSASMRLMSAIGVPQISDASSARSSNARSGSVSRMRYRRRASSRAFSSESIILDQGRRPRT